MKDILIKEDGTLNEERINEYINSYGVNTVYDNPDSYYTNQTLLYTAISSLEIDKDIRLKLVSYLISKGATISETTPDNSGLLYLALLEENLELADFLLENGASINAFYQERCLIDSPLDVKNEQVLRWVLKNAKSLLQKLKTGEINQFYQEITEIFPDAKNSESELHKALKEIANESLQHKFDHLGLIDTHDTALILAAKMSKKDRKNSIFVITDENLAQLMEQIKNLIENDTNENTIKFQIIYVSKGHFIFSEFSIDKTNKPPTVKYLHCDPASDVIPYNSVITPDFIKEISSIANIEVYDSEITLQKGIGCSYFAIDGALLLGTPPGRDYVPNVIEFVKQHGEEEIFSFEGKSIKYIKSPSLPSRFIRGLQYVEDEGSKGDNKGLPSLVFNTEEKNTIVNKKGETAEISIRKDLEKKTYLERTLTYNVRAERKMRQYKNSVGNFMDDKDILDPEFSKLLDQYKINGLVQFCEEKIIPKKEHQIKVK